MDEDQQKWVAKLMGYKFEIHFKPGKDNRVANALSLKAEMELKAVLVWQFDELNTWEEEILQDEWLSTI